MSRQKLESALRAVNWNRNVSEFVDKEAATSELMAQSGLRLAHWAKQFEEIDEGNPAVSFLREMQTAAHHVPALVALALYKPAAAAMRTMLETALYYTYFRSHPVELATLVRDNSYYVSKTEVLIYHNIHTPRFKEVQGKCNLVTDLNEWYGSVSAICHGQIPGGWVSHSGLASVKHSTEICELVTRKFCDGEEIVHKLFLCSIGREIWADITSPAKKALLKGLAGDFKALLGLDAA